MKIAHVITRMIVGGAQENTLFNCLDLREQFGDDVVLLTGPSLGAEGELLTPERMRGLSIVSQPHLIRSIHPANDWRAYRDLQRAIRNFRPDVVHTHSAKGGMLGRAAAWSCHVPCVIHTVHGAPFHPFQPRIARSFFAACERWAAKRCHHMISVADAMTDLMVNANVAPRDKFTTIYSGMDVEPLLTSQTHRAAMRARLGFDEDQVVFGKIARLFHLKGHEYLMEAARQVCERAPNVRFLLVGDGLLRDSFESLLAKQGLSDRFVFTGLVPPEEIPKYISAMDALVHTSLREGLARALPQALIAGKPVISYDVDGAREVVLPGKTGYLLAPKSIDPLANAIEELAANRVQRETLGQQGQRLFTEPFRHQTMSASIRKIYERFLE